MTTQTTIERLGLDDLMQTTQFKLLTVRQQNFVAAYVKSGTDSGTYDGLSSVMTAYNPANVKTASVMLAQVMGNSKVKDVLDLHFGRSEKEAFLRELKKTIQHSKGTAKVKAQAIYAHLAFGYDEPADDDAPETPKPALNIVPEGCVPMLKSGALVGYEKPDGERVRFDR